MSPRYHKLLWLHFWTGKSWHLHEHHTCALLYTTSAVYRYVQHKTQIRQSPSSRTSLAACCNFWLLPKLKTLLMWTLLETREDFIANMMSEVYSYFKTRVPVLLSRKKSGIIGYMWKGIVLGIFWGRSC